MGDSLKLSQLRYVGINAYAEHVQLPRCSYVIVTGFPLIAMKRIVKWCTRVRTCVSHVSKGRFASASERKRARKQYQQSRQWYQAGEYGAVPSRAASKADKRDKSRQAMHGQHGPTRSTSTTSFTDRYRLTDRNSFTNRH